jgi:small subunit ribosomal protein S6
LTRTSYWAMQFDASPPVLKSLHEVLNYDHRVLRVTMLKLGERIEDITKPKMKTFRNPSSISDLYRY